jgi:hypothetical protein
MSAHPALAQWIFKAGFPANDPITELAAAWASGVDADARTIRLALYSAERWREARDKKLKGMAGTLVRKLTDFLKEAERKTPAYRPKYGKGALTGGSRYATNPRRKGRKGRRNPINERDWHIAKQIALAKKAKRLGRRVRPSRRGMKLHLVGANPPRSRRTGRFIRRGR